MAGRRAEPNDDTIEAAIFWVFMAGLAWVPFWFGSNDLTAWGVNAVIFPGLALAFELSLLARGLRHPVSVRSIAAPALLFCAVVTWIVVQYATWTPPAAHHAIWALAAEALARPVAGSISVNRDLTAQALIRLSAAAGVFWLALQLGRDNVRANRMIAGIAAIAVVYAAYGLIAYAVTPGYVLWFEDRFITGYVSSTFYNRNNFATYGGVGFVVLTGLSLRLYHRQLAAGGPGRLRLAAFIETTGTAGAVHLCALFVVLVAVLLTVSRGAIIATLVGGAVLAALTFGPSRKSAVDRRVVVLFVAFIAAAIVLAFGDTLLGKFVRQGLGDESRLAVYSLTVGSIFNAPILGYGYGTFADVFPMFRDRSIDVSGVWAMAHNTYLEIFQGLGLVFGFLLLVSVGLLALRCMKGARVRKMNAAIPAIAASVACLVAVNALVDFSLQIQAVTLTFMAILGVGVAQAESSQVDLQD